MVLKVFRWTPGLRERIQRFWVPAREGMTVLDALVDAQRRLDPTLAFRYACRVGMCGSCAMVVNGRERWACRTRLAALDAATVTLRPLYHFPLIRDLVVDMAPFVEKMQAVNLPEGHTLFDETVLLQGSEIAWNHDHPDMPYLLVAGAQTPFRTGRYLQLPSGTPHNHLLTSIAHAFDVVLDRFGDPRIAPGDLDGALLA